MFAAMFTGWMIVQVTVQSIPGLLRDGLPEGAELTFTADRAEPSNFDPSLPALQAAQRAIEKATGRKPTLVRTGGTLPVLAAFAERGIPAIVSGFSLAEDALHAPNESYRLVALEQGAATARALYQELAGLK
jgi:acetylornithine deacetylase/succinyl-diaminopimelate desuccinylase-like protein